ncbi:hypothetical protein AX16_004536 [Volvariella volvacea WC 439]|nr:hypothetical protein AX16_004536 [Volvariella volvacea WC 439]
MSNEPQKADQIAFHFYTKLFYVVSHARATADPRTAPRIDKWFNLETPDSDLFPREAKEKYKSISASPSASPMEIQVLLCIPELTNKEVLVHVAPDGSRTRIDPTPHHILLESWTLTFSPRRAGREDNLDIALPTIYKHGIPLFRSLFTLLRILPAWSMHKRIKRRTGGPNRNGHLSIKLRVLTGSEDDSVGSLLGFDTPPSSSSPPLQIQSHAFAAVPHPLGTLSLTGAYLTDPNFQLDELESLLSDRFLTLDEGLDFVPTLMKNQSLRSSGVPTGTSPGTRSGAGPGVLSTSPRQFPPSAQRSKSKSPPESIADRFILRSRTSSIVSNPSPGPAPKAQLPPISTADHFNQPLSPSHYRRDSLHVRHASTPVPNTSSSPFPSRDREEPISPISPHPRPPSGLGMNRLRRESAGGVGPGPLGELPSSPSASTFSLASNGGTNPLPIRRSHLNPVNPFKSNTLSSPSSLHSVNAPSPAPSVRGGSPLTVGVTAGTPGSPAIPRPTPSPTTRPSSGLGIPIPPVPGTMRQSPPFGLSQGTPSSLGERRSLRSGEGVTAGSPSPGEESQSPSSNPSGGLLPSPARSLSQRKRYSSSFGHRYAPNAQVPGTPTTAGGALSLEGSPSPSAAGISVPKKDDKAPRCLIATRMALPMRPPGVARRGNGNIHSFDKGCLVYKVGPGCPATSHLVPPSLHRRIHPHLGGVSVVLFLIHDLTCYTSLVLCLLFTRIMPLTTFPHSSPTISYGKQRELEYQYELERLKSSLLASLSPLPASPITPSPPSSGGDDDDDDNHKNDASRPLPRPIADATNDVTTATTPGSCSSSWVTESASGSFASTNSRPASRPHNASPLTPNDNHGPGVGVYVDDDDDGWDWNPPRQYPSQTLLDMIYCPSKNYPDPDDPNVHYPSPSFTPATIDDLDFDPAADPSLGYPADFDEWRRTVNFRTLCDVVDELSVVPGMPMCDVMEGVLDERFARQLELERLRGGRERWLAYMAARTEDDDLSVFIKTIDEAKPLTGRVRIQEDRERDRDGTEREGSVERRREASLERGARVDRGLSPKSPLAVISQEEGESDENVEKQEGEEARPSVLPDGGLGLGDLQVQQQRLPTRAPLNPAGRTPSSPAPAPPIPTTITATATGSPTTGLVPSGLVAPGAAGPSTGVGLSSVPIGSPPGGLVLTSQYEVEAKLKRMNETFKASLEGFEEMVARRDGMKGKAKAANAVDRKPRSASGDSEGHSVTIEVKGPHGHGSSHAQAEREPTRLIGEVGRTGSDEHYGYPYPVPYPPYLGSGHGSAASGSNSGSSGMASAGQGSDEVIGKMDLGESEKRRRSGLSGLRH